MFGCRPIADLISEILQSSQTRVGGLARKDARHCTCAVRRRQHAHICMGVLVQHHQRICKSMTSAIITPSHPNTMHGATLCLCATPTPINVSVHREIDALCAHRTEKPLRQLLLLSGLDDKSKIHDNRLCN